MLKRNPTDKAASTIEYIAVITFIIAAFLVFQRYIFRGMAGSWKAAGDTFGQGRQYDPRPFGKHGAGEGTKECFFDYTHCKPGVRSPCGGEGLMNTWLDRQCVQTRGCDCTIPETDWDEYNKNCLCCYAHCRSKRCFSDTGEWDIYRTGQCPALPAK